MRTTRDDIFRIGLLLYATRAADAFCSSTHHSFGRSISGPLNAKHTSTEEDEIFSTTTNDSTQKFREGSLMAATARTGKVPYGESSRKYRRTVFGHDDWVHHRSEDRFTENLRMIFFSGIVRQLQTQVFVVSAIAAIVVLWNSSLVGVMHLPIPPLSLPTLPFTVSSPALGLLLVFRTNSSYQRWLEARVTWGRIVSQSRNIVRMASTFCNSDENGSTEDGTKRVMLEELTRATWALSRSLMNQLSGPEDSEQYAEELNAAFPPDEDPHGFLSYITTGIVDHHATAALMELSLVLDRIPIDEKRRVEIDKSLVLIGDCMATCDRIYTSPVPLVYSRHSARFLSLYMLLLPLALYETFDPISSASAAASIPWWQHFQGIELIPAASILSLFLFGIEELAVQLEEPFSILPMQKFCDDIRESTTAMKERAIDRKKVRIDA